MKTDPHRHFTEEEFLLSLLDEVSPDLQSDLRGHIERCSECLAVYREYENLLSSIRRWPVQEPSPAFWETQKSELLRLYRRDRERLRSRGAIDSLAWAFRKGWEFALNNPLPTLGYIAAVVAFASERTIRVFRLDEVLPGTTELLEILRQVF